MQHGKFLPGRPDAPSAPRPSRPRDRMFRGPRTVPTTADQRRTTRLACSISVRLQPTGAPAVLATALDLSRRGARLRVPGALLGVYQQAPLAVVAKRVATALGESFEAVLAHDRLGTMITKTLRPVRIGHREGSLADVELGCLMQPPLSDLEASMLGVPLPILKANGSESQARLEVQSVVVRVSGAKAEPKTAPAAAGPAPAAGPESAPAAGRPPRSAPPPVVLAHRPAAPGAAAASLGARRAGARRRAARQRGLARLRASHGRAARGALPGLGREREPPGRAAARAGARGAGAARRERRGQHDPVAGPGVRQPGGAQAVRRPHAPLDRPGMRSRRSRCPAPSRSRSCSG